MGPLSHGQTVVNLDSDTDGESPTMEELIKEKRQVGNVQRQSTYEEMTRATSVPFDVMFSKSLFAPSSLKPNVQAGAKLVPQQQVGRTHTFNPDDLFSSKSLLKTSPIVPPERPVEASSIRQVDTKQDSAVPAKAESKAKVVSITPNKKPSHKPKTKTPPEDPEILRQRLTAQRIIERELKGREDMLDTSLFGEEVTESPEIKMQRLAEERVAINKDRETKMVELLRKEEQDRLLALEKQRVVAAEAEAKRLERDREEAAKKVKRDKQRKKQSAAEAIEQIEKRRLSAERLEEIRQKAKQAAEEKARGRHQGVEASAEELQKLKAKQAESKRLAASLKTAKVPTTSMGIVKEPKSVPKM
jgi:hypothetical protein